jgi:hypothetical protein
MSNGLNVTGGLQFDGKNVGINRGTEQATTSGVSIDFTSIPAGVRRIIVALNGVSLNGSSNLLVQLGVAAGVTTSGYTSGVTAGSTNTASTAGFILVQSPAAADLARGLLILQNISGNTWVGTSNIWNGNWTSNGAGSIALADVLTRLRLTSVNGTDTFDAGAVNIMWEF